MTEQAASQPSVALLGTGIMGTGMARNMLKAGIPLRYGTGPGAAPNHWSRGRGGVQLRTLLFRGADIIVTMLSDGPAVFEAMTVAGPGLTPVNSSVEAATVGLAWLDELAELGRDRALVLIDWLVLGTRKLAEQGAAHRAGPLAGGTRPATASAKRSGRAAYVTEREGVQEPLPTVTARWSRDTRDPPI